MTTNDWSKGSKKISVPTLIFDFDGTLADSLDQSRQVGNVLAPRFGLQPVSLETFAALRELTVAEIQKQLKIPTWKIPLFLFFFRREMLQRLPSLNCVEGMPNVLKQLQEKQVQLGILTSNTLSNVNAFLEHHQLRSYFQFVDGGVRILGKGQRLRRLLKQNNLDPRYVFYVGDEIRDVLAAQQVGIQSVAVTWGFNTSEALRSLQPTFLIDHPLQLLEIIEMSDRDG